MLGFMIRAFCFMTYSGDVILNEATLALYVSAVRISTIILEALTALRPHRGACVAPLRES